MLCIALSFVLTVGGGALAGGTFGYGNVYELDDQGVWQLVSDGDVTVNPVGGSKSRFDNVGGAFGISVGAELAFENVLDDTGGLSLFGAAAFYATESNTAEFVSSCGMFKITVTARPFEDPDLVNMVWVDEPWVDDKGNFVSGYFYLPYSKTKAQWQFTYRVTNTLDKAITINEVKDNFGAELDLVGDPTTHWGTDISETIIMTDWAVRRSSMTNMVIVQGAPTQREVPVDTGTLIIIERAQNFGFQWQDFQLQPGEWAEVTFVLETGLNPAGIQSYSSCGWYALNSEGALKYRYDGQPGQGQISVAGKTFWVSVCTPPSTSICVEINTGVDWYLLKPGSYFAQIIEGRVTVQGNGQADVAVTFDDFDDLKKGDEVLPVQYFIGEAAPEPSDWFSPSLLNETTVALTAAESTPAYLWVWQNVVLEGQSPGQYTNTGVITFTLINSKPFVEP